MTLRSGEESPTARVDAEAEALDWDDDSTPKASVRPIETGEHLMPLVPVSTEPEEERVEGETFHERMTRLAVPESSSARGVLREEFSEAAAAEKEAAFHDEDGAICFEGQSGEGRTVKLPPDVPVPSREMVRRHRAAGHCPYRPWCAHCVSGAANLPCHRARNQHPTGEVPEMHADYAFFRDKKGEKGRSKTVLIVKDRASGGISANVVPKKGVGGGFAVKQFERDIRRFGHRKKLLLRSDGEPAVKDLLEKVADYRTPETVIEQSPVEDSRANGLVERAVQAVEKQVRVIKMATEEQVGKFSVMHPAFPWLVVHSADVLNKFQVQKDGLTAYEKVKGREYSGLMLEFGSVVLHKASAKVQGGVMAPRWLKGVWLGKRFGTEEHVIATPEGNVFRSCAVKPHPEIQFDTKIFDAIKGSPWNPQGFDGDEAGLEPPEHTGNLPRVMIPRSVETAIPQARRVLISREYLDRFGFTPGCPKCTAISVGDTTKPSLGHNGDCRERIEKLMKEDPFLSKKVEKANRRQDVFWQKGLRPETPKQRRRRLCPLRMLTCNRPLPCRPSRDSRKWMTC